MPAITDFSKPSALTELNDYLLHKSYVVGYGFSEADKKTFEALKTAPPQKTAPNAHRWYQHVKALLEDPYLKSISQMSSADQGSADQGPADQGPDDIDLFGSDDEDAEAAEKVRKARMAASDNKAKAGGVVAKSLIVLEVKPWDDSTDLVAMTKAVKEITMEGLVWGTDKLVPIGYGIKKLSIACVVEDAKVGVDDITEAIEGLEDYVQSVDIASFNKL